MRHSYRVYLTALSGLSGSRLHGDPAGLGAGSGLPVGVSLIGAAGDDDRIVDIADALQAELGVPTV